MVLTDKPSFRISKVKIIKNPFLFLYQCIFPAKFAKVMFSHVSVCPQGLGLSHCMLGYTLRDQRQTPPPGRLACAVHAGIRSTSRQYASHWNAFLFQLSFSRSRHNRRRAILPTSFLLWHSKLKRPKKSATLKGNPFYQLTSNFTFTNIFRSKLPTLYVKNSNVQTKCIQHTTMVIQQVNGQTCTFWSIHSIVIKIITDGRTFT